MLTEDMFSDLRERERERKREGHQCTRETSGCLPCVPHTGDGTYNLGMCPHWELNPQSFGVREHAPTN